MTKVGLGMLDKDVRGLSKTRPARGLRNQIPAAVLRGYAMKPDADADNMGMAEPDAELLARARDGDRDAFAELARRHQADLLRVAGRFVASREDAEDAVQEALVAAYRQLHRFRGDSSLKTWLTRIAINRALKIARRRGIEQRSKNHRRPASQARPDPAETLAVREAVSRLPSALRVPVVLRFWEGMSGAEIAETLGCKQSTVWTRLYRGLERLRKDLGEEAMP